MSLIKFLQTTAQGLTGAIPVASERSIFYGDKLLTDVVTKDVQLNITGNITTVFDLLNDTWLNRTYDRNIFNAIGIPAVLSFKYDMILKIRFGSAINASATINCPKISTKNLSTNEIHAHIDLTNFATGWGTNIATANKFVTLGTNLIEIMVHKDETLCFAVDTTVLAQLSLKQKLSFFNWYSWMELSVKHFITTGGL